MTQTNLLARISAVRDELSGALLERETAIEVALVALLTREHMLLLGPPGTAKSLLVRSICDRIGSARMFEVLLTRFSTPEEIFGPLSLAALEKDEYRRITTGTLCDAEIAFLDEIWKSNSAILNSLLALVNERVYFEAGKGKPVPLLSLFAASNETPEDDSLNALYDRFLLRVSIPYLASDDSLRKLFAISELAPSAIISLDDLAAAQREVAIVSLSDPTIDAMLGIKHDLEAQGLAASDRRWRACGELVKAKAWLEGDAVTSPDHCEVLVHALWSEPANIRVVERIVNAVACPLNFEAVELEDAALEIYKERPEIDHPRLTEALEPFLKQLSDIHTRLELRIAAAPPRRSVRAREALQKVHTWHKALAGLALQSLSVLHTAPGAA